VNRTGNTKLKERENIRRDITILQRNDLLIVLSLILFAAIYAFSKDFTASGTILLAIATFILARDSSKNIEISKNNLAQQNLKREMEQFIKPLYQKRERLEDLEYVHSFNNNEARLFWENILADKYLAPRDLRDLIDEYLKINIEWVDKLSSMRGKISVAHKEEYKSIPQTTEFINMFSHHFHRLPQKDFRNRELQSLNDLIEKLNLESKTRKCIEEYINIIRDDIVLEDKRLEIREKIEARYNELEEKMDKIRDSLE
jgi:hypothetical protein